MTENIAPRRGELVIEKDGRPTLRFQKFLEGIASATSGGGADGYVTANAAITPATKTKITYDEKGLVTGGSNATTADIVEAGNLYFTASRVASTIIDGDHLTWTFDGTNLRGDVLVTLQNAYDDSLSGGTAEIVMSGSEFLNIQLGSSGAFYVGTASNFLRVSSFHYAAFEHGDTVFTDATNFYNWLVNYDGALEFRGDTIRLHGYVSAQDRVETSNDYLTVGT